ncbi:MAG: DNA modification methylase [bacterium]
MNNLEIKYISIDQIKPNEYNPKQMTKKEAEDLEKSIVRFGIVDPLIVNEAENRKGIIIGGHQRYEIYKKLNYKKAPVVFINIPNLEKEQELCLRLSKNVGEWDFDLLANFDENLLLDIGFDKSELDSIFEIEPTPVDDEVPEIKKETDIKLRDLFQLGKHRIMCGDSTKREDVEKLMQGNKGVLGFTSPPYWVGKEYEKQKSVIEIEEFIEKVCQSYNLAIQKDKSRIVINTGTGFTTSFDKRNKRQVLLLIDKWTNSFFELGWNLRHIRHWIKEGQLISTSPKSDLIDQHCEFLGTYENDIGEEMTFNDILNEKDINILETFYNKKGIHIGMNKQAKKWALRSYWDDIKGNANQEGHCASFPVELVIRHLLLYTQRGDVALDLFLGSGSTLIACEKANRICYGMEIEPIYCQLTIDRWEKFTGQKSICLNNAI